MLTCALRPPSSSYTIKFSILDWDKASGNDYVGEATCAPSNFAPLLLARR